MGHNCNNQIMLGPNCFGQLFVSIAFLGGFLVLLEPHNQGSEMETGFLNM